jgi:uncharacterized protein
METRIAASLTTDGRRLTGYAARFDQAANLGRFKEIIKRGAFAGSLAGDVLCLADHDPSKILGRTKSGTLRLSEDDQGLRYELDLPDTSVGRDLLALATRGDLGGMSFGFTVAKNGQEWISDTRILNKIDLKEISVVSSWPAYDGTSVDVRRGTCRNNRFTRFLETV